MKIKRFIYRKLICPSCEFRLNCLFKDEFKSDPYCKALNSYLLACFFLILIVALAATGKLRSYSTLAYLASSIIYIFLSHHNKKRFQRMLVLNEEHCKLNKEFGKVKARYRSNHLPTSKAHGGGRSGGVQRHSGGGQRHSGGGQNV